VNYSALAELFIEALRKIAELDFFDSQKIMNWLGYSTEKTKEVNFESAGFASSDIIMNFSLYILVIGLILILLLLAGIMIIIMRKHE
jgi:hypothetical protein